jgi:hypothetical protein
MQGALWLEVFPKCQLIVPGLSRRLCAYIMTLANTYHTRLLRNTPCFDVLALDTDRNSTE